MPSTVQWQDLAIRLVLTVIAGGLIGLNRGERGHSAGLRTTLLVCLAASVAMIQMNLLLAASGKTPQSFSVIDVARLPLGILSGIGFIGAGAILRRGGRVEGVTTAATMWIVTVIGLCLGGGQYALGIAATLLTLFVLWCLKWVERRHFHGDRRATLTLAVATDRFSESVLDARVEEAGFRITRRAIAYCHQGARCEMRYELQWHPPGPDKAAPEFLGRLAREPGMIRVDWQPLDERTVPT